MRDELGADFPWFVAGEFFLAILDACDQLIAKLASSRICLTVRPTQFT